MAQIGSPLVGLYQDQPRSVDATPPPQASDGAYEPEYGIPATIAGDTSTFIAHGVSVDDLGSFPGGARASQIQPDLTGPQIVNPARSRDGYTLQGPGTPEPAINAPRQGAILDSRGIIHLGIGPGIPLALVAIIAGYLYLSRHKGPVVAA